MPQDSSDENRLRTVKDAMHFLGVARNTIYRLASKGDLELVKIGSATRVTQASLDHYVRNARRIAQKQ